MSNAFSDFYKRHRGILPSNATIDEEEFYSADLSDDALKDVVGGKLTPSDIAYCKMTVEFYHSRGYTLEGMKNEILAYQQSLMNQGKTALAARTAEYLDYMITIW